MGRLPASWIQELLDRAKLRDLVGRYVALQPKGQRLWGPCPFHHERDPSFTVNEQGGFYHCFGCGKHGNAIDFVMEIEHLDFREACSYLASQVGLEMPQDETPADQKKRAVSSRIKQLNREAAAFYHQILRSNIGKKGEAYFRERGIDAQLCSKYGLGYAPDAWHTLRTHLKKKGFSDQEAELSGLVHEKNGSRYDAFRDRVIFPIINSLSEVIGFGGRILGEGQPKYLNSPATPVFNKRQSLFNLNTIKQLKNRGELKRLILMEGYMDVIGAARFGVFDTCATLGTALTQEQCTLLKRYTAKVLICYDGDGAGVKAAGRALGLLSEAGLDSKVVYLPDGMDPDEFLKKQGREEFDARCEQALSPIDFKFAIASQGLNLENTDQKAEYVKKCVEILREESNPIDQQAYAKKLAQQTNYAPYSIEQMLGTPGKPVQVPRRITNADTRAENFVVALVLSRPDAVEDLCAILTQEDFQNPVNRAIYAYILETLQRKIRAGTAEVKAIFETPKEQAYVETLMEAFAPYEKDKKACDDMLFQSTKRLMIRSKMRQLTQARHALKNMVSEAEKSAKMAEVARLTKELETLKKMTNTSIREA